jgi:hypothetical protein
MLPAEYKLYLSRHATPEVKAIVGCDDESELHRQIKQFCSQHNWPFGNCRMDRATGMVEGWPDFVIIAECKVWFIECKTKTGKLSREQLGMAMLFENQGHKIHVVRSFQEFIELLNKQNP